MVDPRIAQRRQLVAEHGARRRLRSMFLVALALGLVGLGWWATQSELLDIDTITIGPADKTDVAVALQDAGIGEGSTLIAAILAADDIEAALETSPWVRGATVNVLFPGKIEVEVLERQAAVVVAGSDGGWMLAAGDMTLLESVAAPLEGYGVISDPDLLAGGLAFLEVMGERAAGTTLSVIDGEVWVESNGVRGRLGRDSEMEAKAAAFTALLEEEVAEGWAINLVAPSRPAVFQIDQP